MARSKTCSKCGETKPITEYRKKSDMKDGFRAHCKACNNIADALYRALNKEKVRAGIAKWRLENPDRVKAKVAEWRAANPEKVKAIHAKWVAENPEKCRAKTAKWAANNKDKVVARAAKYRALNPEANRIACQNRRARKHAAGGKITKGLPERLYKLQRGKCACGCKQPLGTNYHLDHILPLSLGGSNTDDNIQLLRSTCNQQKYSTHPIEFMQRKGFLL